MVCSLPNELVADVMDHFVDSNTSHASRLPNLANFARVNPSWNDVSTVWLYRNLYLDSQSRSAILDTLEGNPNLAQHVRILSLSGGKLSDEEFVRLRQVLGRCTNVTNLSYHCFAPHQLAELVAFIAETWNGLKYLRADQSQFLYDLLSHLPHLEELVASYIEFPAASTLSTAASTALPPSRPETPFGSPSSSSSGGRLLTPPRPVRPSFKLRRLDSGSALHPLNFDLLLSTSSSTLLTLDLPITSLLSQDLSVFSALRSLTLTLAERYIPTDADLPTPLQPGQPGTGRNDARCLRRLKRVLSRAESAGVPLTTLEIFEPRYPSTTAFSAGVFEEEDILASVPTSVRSLDLSTTALSLRYLREAFSRDPSVEEEAYEGAKAKCCVGVREVVLGLGSAKGETEEKVARTVKGLGRRGVMIRWV
jgi:hypothetical protein